MGAGASLSLGAPTAVAHVPRIPIATQDIAVQPSVARLLRIAISTVSPPSPCRNAQALSGSTRPPAIASPAPKALRDVPRDRSGSPVRFSWVFLGFFPRIANRCPTGRQLLNVPRHSLRQVAEIYCSSPSNIDRVTAS